MIGLGLWLDGGRGGTGGIKPIPIQTGGQQKFT